MKWIKLATSGLGCLAALLASNRLLASANSDWESLEGLWLGLLGVALAVVFSTGLQAEVQPRTTPKRRLR